MSSIPPGWCGLSRYVPEILDVVTMEDVVEELAVAQFAERTDIDGTAGTFHCPQADLAARRRSARALARGPAAMEPRHKPWFYRDVWRSSSVPISTAISSSILGLSNYPHN